MADCKYRGTRYCEKEEQDKIECFDGGFYNERSYAGCYKMAEQKKRKIKKLARQHKSGLRLLFRKSLFKFSHK